MILEFMTISKSMFQDVMAKLHPYGLEFYEQYVNKGHQFDRRDTHKLYDSNLFLFYNAELRPKFVDYIPDLAALQSLSLYELEKHRLVSIHYRAEAIIQAITFEFSNKVFAPPLKTYPTKYNKTFRWKNGI